jgi:hypothetical protein
MRIRLGVYGVFACLALGLTACGDDDGDDGGGGCANAQMVCANDPDVEINCSEFDSAPASVKQCAGAATTCAAVQACIFQMSPVAGSGG